jgi:hypothetical protein
MALVMALLSAHCAPGAGEETWPKQVTLHASADDEGEGVRLVDGVVVKHGGDLYFAEPRVFVLGARGEGTFCEKGPYDSLAAVPTDEGSCTRGTAAGQVYLGGAAFDFPGEGTGSIGLGVLVRDATHGVLYRLRVLGVGYVKEGAMLRFEYEPVP